MRFKRLLGAATMAASLSLGIVGATMPAASAAPAAPAAAAAPARAAAATHPNGTTALQKPDIKWNACAAGTTTTWVTLIEIELSGGSVYTNCYGYTGTWTFSNQSYYVTHFCSGNNKGTFSYTVNGTTHSFSFGPGTNKNLGTGPNKPKTLTITGWSGSDRCTV